MKSRKFNCGNFEITFREILASISIIAVLLLIGFVISGKISQSIIDKNEKYNKALKIENSQEMFQYGMDTNVGNAFVYGELKAVDSVTYPEIGGEYMCVKKVKEKYTRHTRKVSHGSGKHKHYTTQVYWTWDYVGKESKECKKLNFCGIEFDSNKIRVPEPDYIDTIKESSHIRYKYYGTGTKYIGTIFSNLKDNTILDNTKFYDNKNINETVKNLKTDGKIALIVFWIFWIISICGVVFVFYYLDNNWLE